MADHQSSSDASEGLLASLSVDDEKSDKKFALPPSKPMTKKGMIAASSYMTCAVVLVMLNKSALSSYEFPSANVITLLQMIVSTSLLVLLSSLNLISFHSPTPIALPLLSDGSEKLHPRPASPKKARFVSLATFLRVAPLSLSYLFYMVVSMASIRRVNVPMYTSLRRTTVVITLALEILFMRGQVSHSRNVFSSVLVIVLGALLAGLRDISFELYGYSIVLLANFATAVYLTTIAKLSKGLGLNSFGLMWCNGLFCGPVLFVWTLLSGELKTALNFPHLHSLNFQLVLLLSCLTAFALNFTIFVNTALNSALTQNICGNLKDFGTVTIGWALFGGLKFDALNILGQLIGFIGSGFYAYCKIKGI